MSDTIVIAKVTGVFGLRGDVKVEVAAFSLEPGLETEVEGPTFERHTLRVAQVRPAGSHLRVRFEGIDDATSAARLRGAAISVARAALPALPEGTCLESELVGMEVIDRTRGGIGRVTGIAHYPGSDMLVVGPQRALVPMLLAYGVSVDRANRTIATDLPDGFDDLL